MHYKNISTVTDFKLGVKLGVKNFNKANSMDVFYYKKEEMKIRMSHTHHMKRINKLEQ